MAWATGADCRSGPGFHAVTMAPVTVLITYDPAIVVSLDFRPNLQQGAPMPILRIQPAVPTFDGWRRAFDADLMDRRASGVRRYQVHRSVTDPNFVMIDLELETLQEAEKLLERLRLLMGRPRRSRHTEP
jgi:hypothetical protein